MDTLGKSEDSIYTLFAWTDKDSAYVAASGDYENLLTYIKEMPDSTVGWFIVPGQFLTLEAMKNAGVHPVERRGFIPEGLINHFQTLLHWGFFPKEPPKVKNVEPKSDLAHTYTIQRRVSGSSGSEAWEDVCTFLAKDGIPLDYQAVSHLWHMDWTAGDEMFRIVQVVDVEI